MLENFSQEFLQNKKFVDKGHKRRSFVVKPCQKPIFKREIDRAQSANKEWKSLLDKSICFVEGGCEVFASEGKGGAVEKGWCSGERERARDTSIFLSQSVKKVWRILCQGQERYRKG